MLLQVVQANATTPKPSRSSSLSSPASFRYKATVLEPGAREDFTQGLRLRPSLLALRASRPAAITLRGLLVLVQLVMAAMMTAPSGQAVRLLGAGLVRSTAIPRSARAETGRRRWGLGGPARCVPRSTSRSAAPARIGRLPGRRPRDPPPGEQGLHQPDLLVITAGGA